MGEKPGKDGFERALIDKDLLESEEKYRALLEAAAEGLLVADIETTELKYANPAICRMLGYTPQELARMRLFDIHPEASRDSMIRELEAQTRGGKTRVHNIPCLRKDGSLFYSDITSAKVSLDRRAYVVSLFTDVTDRKEAEEALKRRLAYEKMLNTISAQSISAFDTNKFLEECVEIMGKMLDVSRVYVFEHRNETDSMDNTFEWCAPDIPPQKAALQGLPSHAIPWWMNRIRSGEIINYTDIEDIPGEQEREVLRPQGIKSILVVPLHIDGRYYGFIGFDECRDHRQWMPEDVDILVTISRIISRTIAREKAEEILRFEREQLLSIFNSINEIIYITDPLTYEIIYVNKTFTDLLGRDVVGGLCYEEFQGQESPCGFCTNEIILNNGYQPYSWEYHNPILQRDLMIIDRIVKWPTGKDVRFEIAIDITARKKAEEEKRHLQTQLHQAQRMEAIGTLAGGIAHDFNNLLMGIVGRTSLMLHRIDPSHPHYDHLKGIEEYVESAADLTKELLGFARGGKYQVQPVNLNDLVKKSAGMFGRTKKEINVHMKFQEGVWTVEVDPTQIEQVFLNLYVNAWQSMPGGGDLYVETENVTLDRRYSKAYGVTPGPYVKISVMDTGTGMDERTREKVFEPFFTTKEMGRGTGLGLASAYGIIKNHGGVIKVYSEKGEGTVFNIYLPGSDKEVSEREKGTGELTKGTETVLLVDDESITVDVGKELLEELGYKVMAVKSGAEAIDLYEKHAEEIDLVILDMIMPNMDGGETFERLRETDPNVKVLLSSGYSLDRRAQQILDRGCRGFLQKPFKLTGLSQKIREILEGT